MHSSGSVPLRVALLVVAMATSVLGQTSDPRILYNELLDREAVIRKDLDAKSAPASRDDLLKRIRTLAGSYQDMAKLFPKSGYSDDALWHGGTLSADAFTRFAQAADRTRAIELLETLASDFPGSTLVRQVPAQLAKLGASAAQTPSPPPPQALSAQRTSARNTPSLLKAIRREVLPDALRFTLEIEREVAFRDERLDGPPRVFVDLQNTRASEPLKDATLPFPDDVVKRVRIGRQADARTRVVFDLTASGPHSVYALYNPFRIVVDLARPIQAVPDARRASNPGVPPAAAAANTGGGFSLSRQLGLGVARVVIDPGHGGHDPGAQIKGLTEADLVLDVAMRLEKLLAGEGIEVLLTRRSDTYLTLEERTAKANQSEADLFLSIHANASTIATANGVETYFLNFAQNKEAEAIAARENAASARSMHQLPDLVRAITTNNKLDESRDFARMVQASLFDELRKTNKSVKNLGVKQAPFMVLIGATMPAALSEIAFMTNRQEATLIRTEQYRQKIAEALSAGVLRYQDSLKKTATVATQ